jgi:hypothetical protein
MGAPRFTQLRCKDIALILNGPGVADIVLDVEINTGCLD